MDRIAIEQVLEVGVAVSSVQQARRFYIELLGARLSGFYREARYYNMFMQMCRVGNIDIELMTSICEDSVIYSFIKKRGQGLHHIAFKVADVCDGIAWMKHNNVKVINESPNSIDDVKFVFLHPESFDGVMFELVQGEPHWVGKKVLPAELTSAKDESGPLGEGLLEVGIVVSDLHLATKLYEGILGAISSQMIHVAMYDIRMKVCHVGNVDFKLMEPMTENSVVSGFLRKRGPGLHHITLKVSNIDYAIAWLRNHGARMIDEVPRVFDDVRFAFVHPQSFNGVMIELSEGGHRWLDTTRVPVSTV